MSDTQDLRKRLEVQIANRGSIEATWRQVEKWVGPLAGGVPANEATVAEGAVDWERGEVWDSTAPSGADILANSIYTNLTNPSVRWAKFKWLSKTMQDDTEAASWLDESEDLCFAELAASDFYTEVAAFDSEWVRYGTACFVAEAKKDAIEAKSWKGLDFTAPPIRECYFEPAADGSVYRFWHVFQWTAVQISSKFKKDQAALPPKITAKLETPEAGTEKMKVAYAIYVRPEFENKEKKSPLGPELRPVGGCYFLVEDGDQLGDELGFYEMPVYIVPWERAAGSQWGHSPGIRCLPTVRYLNSRLQQQREAGEKAVDPAFTVTERGLMSDADQRSGGMTVVRTQEDLKVFESGSKFNVGEQDIADLRAQVRGIFWSDELSLKLSPQMTATEVNARIDQMNRLFGPTLAGYQSLKADPLLKLVFAMLYRAGKLPKMPPSVEAALKNGQAEYAIQYQGPLSRAQRADEVAAIERVASAASAMKKMEFEDVDLVFNEEQALREIAKRLGTPASILYSEKDVKAKKEARRAQQAAAAAAEVAKTQAEANDANASARVQAGGTGSLPQSVPAQPAPLLAPPLM